MMNALEFAEKTLSTMKCFREKVEEDKAIVNKTIVSRLYYGMHHLARHLLKIRGKDPSGWRKNVHRRVMDALKTEYVLTDRMDREVFELLRGARKQRIKADHEISKSFGEEVIDELFENYVVFLNQCKRAAGIQQGEGGEKHVEPRS